MQQHVWDLVRERYGIEVPKSGEAIRIIRKNGAGGQVQAVYRFTAEEGFVYSNPGRSLLSFEAWENVMRLEKDKA